MKKLLKDYSAFFFFKKSMNILETTSRTQDLRRWTKDQLLPHGVLAGGGSLDLLVACHAPHKADHLLRLAQHDIQTEGFLRSQVSKYMVDSCWLSFGQIHVTFFF